MLQDPGGGWGVPDQYAWDVPGGSQGGALVAGMSPSAQEPSGHWQ